MRHRSLPILLSCALSIALFVLVWQGVGERTVLAASFTVTRFEAWSHVYLPLVLRQ